MSDNAVPDLPPGFIRRLPGRGEMFYRHHRGRVGSPTVLLLHGWTASADLQFIAAYPALDDVTFIAVDHRGHGRGIRSVERYDLEVVADDVAALLRDLERTGDVTGPVVAVGYSMGGPIAMLLTRRHRDLVKALVVQATALEWNSTRRDRGAWQLLRLSDWLFRSRLTARLNRTLIDRSLTTNAELAPYRDWLRAESRRGDAVALHQAGRALASYDATEWASTLDVPSAIIVTTRDRLVRPHKQRALAAALDARVFEVHGDHLAHWANGAEFASATRAAIDHVAIDHVVGDHDHLGDIPAERR
ncbi:MAG: alpha/beta fold hydrolase [Acidimicrobiia bacterium]